MAQTKLRYEQMETGRELISDTLLSADTASIDITNIPATYKHLVVHISARTDVAGTADSLRMRVNNNSTADDHVAERMYAVGAAFLASEWVTNETSAVVGWATGATAAARYFAIGTMWINDYANTDKAPSWVTSTGFNVGVVTNNVATSLFGGMLDVASAVSRLTFFPDSGSNLVEGTRISLYGIN